MQISINYTVTLSLPHRNIRSACSAQLSISAVDYYPLSAAAAQFAGLGLIAKLRMDDVEDNSELRRGLPVAHLIYGIPQAINTANYVYFLAMQELIKLNGPSGQRKGKGKEVDLMAVVMGESIPLV